MMNFYQLIGSRVGTAEAIALSGRLAAWHDAMVTHERRLRAGRTPAECDEDCPHAEATALWFEAVTTLGERANELAFLRSHGQATVRLEEGALHAGMRG
jgi:hypothetical protein